MPSRRRQFSIGLLLFALGAGALLLAYVLDDSPTDVDIVRWALFAAAYALLSFQSVEVNDRLIANAAIMPLLTAGVAFALDGRGGVIFPLAMVAALSPIDRLDLRERLILRPIANFSQLVISAAAAGVAIEAVAEYGLSLRLDVSGDTQNYLVGAVAGLAGAIVNSILNYLLVRLGIRLLYGRSTLLPWGGMLSIFSTQTFMGLLGGLLGAILVIGSASILPLILIVYITGYLAVSSYSQLRQAHESTIKGFVKTLEARDVYTRGHTEQVAEFARMIGERLGFTGTQLERMRYAALIHDVGKLGIPLEIMQKQGKLDDDEYRTLRTATHRVDDLLSEVDFLRPMVEVASGSHPRLPHEDFGQTGHRHTARPSLEQRVLAVADAFEAMVSTRGYRMAMSQRAALDALRRHEAVLYDNDVIDALEQAIAATGKRHGPRDLDLPDSPEVARAQ